jgi:hypothetical protein
VRVELQAKVDREDGRKERRKVSDEKRAARLHGRRLQALCSVAGSWTSGTRTCAGPRAAKRTGIVNAFFGTWTSTGFECTFIRTSPDPGTLANTFSYAMVQTGLSRGMANLPIELYAAVSCYDTGRERRQTV